MDDREEEEKEKDAKAGRARARGPLGKLAHRKETDSVTPRKNDPWTSPGLQATVPPAVGAHIVRGDNEHQLFSLPRLAKAAHSGASWVGYCVGWSPLCGPVVKSGQNPRREAAIMIFLITRKLCLEIVVIFGLAFGGINPLHLSWPLTGTKEQARSQDFFKGGGDFPLPSPLSYGSAEEGMIPAAGHMPSTTFMGIWSQ